MLASIRRQLRDRRLWTSSAGSALLWMAFPLVTMGYRSPGTATLLSLFFPIAVIMHLIEAERLLRYQGWRFWLYPFKTLPMAVAVYMPLEFLVESKFSVPHMNGDEWEKLAWSPLIVLYYWLLGVLMVVVYWIWITYPLAILNQFLIRQVYRGKPGAPLVPKWV